MINCELGNVWSTKQSARTFYRWHKVSVSYWLVWQFSLPLYTTFVFSGCLWMLELSLSTTFTPAGESSWERKFLLPFQYGIKFPIFISHFHLDRPNYRFRSATWN